MKYLSVIYMNSFILSRECNKSHLNALKENWQPAKVPTSYRLPIFISLNTPSLNPCIHVLYRDLVKYIPLAPLVDCLLFFDP